MHIIPERVRWCMYEKGPTPEWTCGDSTDQKKETCHHIKRQGKSGSSRAERE